MSATLALWHLLFLLSCGASLVQQAAAVCDSGCQQAQETSLVQLFSQTAGSRWNTSFGWGSQQSNQTAEPAYCAWLGVACCLQGGSVDLRFFPSTIPINCSSPGGVAALLLPNNNLSGVLGGVDWASFAPSLQYIDLSGMPLTVFLSCCLLIRLFLPSLQLQWRESKLIHIASRAWLGLAAPHKLSRICSRPVCSRSEGSCLKEHIPVA